jgi:hypothetical protein
MFRGGLPVGTGTGLPAFKPCRARAVPTLPAPRMRIDPSPSAIGQLLARGGLAELSVDQGLYSGAQQLDRAQQILLRDMPNIHLEELAHVAHLLLEIDNAPGDLLRCADEQRALAGGWR